MLSDIICTLMDLILPSVLGNTEKRRTAVQKRLLRRKKLREAQLKRDKHRGGARRSRSLLVGRSRSLLVGWSRSLLVGRSH